MMLVFALNSILIVSIILLGNLVLVAAEDNAKSCAKSCMSRSI